MPDEPVVPVAPPVEEKTTFWEGVWYVYLTITFVIGTGVIAVHLIGGTISYFEWQSTIENRVSNLEKEQCFTGSGYRMTAIDSSGKIAQNLTEVKWLECGEYRYKLPERL